MPRIGALLCQYARRRAAFCTKRESIRQVKEGPTLEEFMTDGCRAALQVQTRDTAASLQQLHDILAELRQSVQCQVVHGGCMHCLRKTLGRFLPTDQSMCIVATTHPRDKAAALGGSVSTATHVSPHLVNGTLQFALSILYAGAGRVVAAS